MRGRVLLRSSQKVDLNTFAVDGRLSMVVFVPKTLINTLQNAEHRNVRAFDVGQKANMPLRIPKDVDILGGQYALRNANSCCGLIRVQGVRTNDRKIRRQPSLLDSPQDIHDDCWDTTHPECAVQSLRFNNRRLKVRQASLNLGFSGSKGFVGLFGFG